MRYELKYTFPTYYYDRLIRSIMNSSNLYNEIYYERQVNNIYFDTDTLHDYHQNLAGDSQRNKYRIRWYGKLHNHIEKPTLEKKFKIGQVGGKNSISLPGFDYSDGFSYRDYYATLRNNLADPKQDQAALILELMLRKPTIVNSYLRRYFISPGGHVRVTLDREIYYYHAQNDLLRHKFKVNDPHLILEVKYEEGSAHKTTRLVEDLGYRISKNSKYVNGVNALYFEDKLY